MLVNATECSNRIFDQSITNFNDKTVNIWTHIHEPNEPSI